MHNLAFYHGLMREARAHIIAGDYAAWSAEWIAKWEK
jgi:queuine tRNA-ribosyltransferase